jgi:short-subunit dehydrogenase
MSLRLKPLADQVIVILGASSGIGLATARLGASQGARMVLAARSAHALERLATELRRGRGDAIAVTCDVSSEDDVRRVAARAIDAFGRIDTWVNNAAVSAYGTCLEVSSADMRRIMDVNFWGVVHGSRVACGHMREHGGALINLGSVLSDRAVPLQGAYSASKHAIKGWTDALRVELGVEGVPISVTLIKPSAIGTPYAEHASNYFPDQPTHLPPVYAPRSVAKAILHAAQHPTRDIVVGGSGVVLSMAGAIAPRLTDALLARFLVPGMHSGRLPGGRSAVHEPSEDLRERGDYPGIVRPSLYTALATHPRLAALAAGAAAGLLLMTRSRGRFTAPAPAAAASETPV